VANSFEENDCENTNTHAHGDVHLVVLAYLQRRCCLRGGEVWRLPLPPAELVRQDSAKKRRRIEVTGSDRMRPISGSNSRARGAARVSNRSIRSVTGLARPVKPQRNCEAREVDRTWWCVRSQSTERVRLHGCLLEMTGRWHCGVRFVLWRVRSLTRWRTAVCDQT
jgi:hypothetical protein